MIVLCAQSHALDTKILTVESCFTRGFAGVQLIGNVNEVCKSGVERAKNAVESLGVSIPNKKIVINIAPGEIKKEGTQFDLAFAINLYQVVTNRTPRVDLQQWMIVGELGLDGGIRGVKSVVSYVITAVSSGLKGIILPFANSEDVKILTEFDLPGIKNFRIIGVSKLEELISWLYHGKYIGEVSELTYQKYTENEIKQPNFDDMIMSEEMILASLTVATGLHSIMLYGTPGAGKSMFASRISSIFPAMGQREHMDALRIASSCQEIIPPQLLAGRPPSRAPHHQASASAILGTAELPGELSLAHGGILFLDEFPEFRRDIIEALREPLETGEVRVSRAKKKIHWKARICLVTAANNCPCGWFGSSKKKCRCPHSKIQSYRQKISGPILDRIDIHMNFPESKSKKSSLFAKKDINQSEVLKEKVLIAREFSKKRNMDLGVELNCDLQAMQLPEASGLNKKNFDHLVDSLISKSTSSRGVVRSLRVARSLADLDQSFMIRETDLKQAVFWQSESAAIARGDDLLGL